MEWFERWFGEDYLLVYEHRDCAEAAAEAEAVIGILGLSEGELVLDLCCGPGRHAGPLVNHGCHVYGLDYSMHLLKLACGIITGNSSYPRYIRGDARMLPFRDGAFDAVLNMFTSFGYFDDAGNENLIRSIARILKPGGRFLIDYFNTPRVIDTINPRTVREKNGMTIREERTINTVTKRVEKTISLTTSSREETFHESVRLYTEPEMRTLIEHAGLSVAAVYGASDRSPYNDTAERMIFHGEKRR